VDSDPVLPSDGRQASRNRRLDGLLGLLLLLECLHARVYFAALQQLPVTASLDDAAGFRDQDLVGTMTVDRRCAITRIVPRPADRRPL